MNKNLDQIKRKEKLFTVLIFTVAGIIIIALLMLLLSLFLKLQ